MPDTIGRITVPEVAASGTFPLATDYAFGRRIRKPVAVHRFESGAGKIEQRFLLGPAVTVHRWGRREMSPSDVKALRDFWEARSGPYQPFTYNAPADDHGGSTTAVTVRFADESLTLEHLGLSASAGVEMIELPSSTPTYTVTSTLDRFPDSTFATALLGQEHEIIPLLKIRVSEAAVDDIFLSDRRCTVGGQLYLERLLSWNGVTQSIEGGADVASFDLGNADGVMRELAADTNLRRAWAYLSFYHVASETLVNVWAGRVLPEGGWEGETDDVFRLNCSDPISAVNIPYPRQKVSRRCWKTFDDGVQCPYTSAGSLNGSYPSASAGSCDKGWETPNGCRAHNMDGYHGGIQQSPARARIKLQNTGVGFGAGRKTQTVASLINENAFLGGVIPEIWTDISTAVPGLIVAGRDEDEFYDVLFVVGAGPLQFGSGHRLDGQAHHGPGSTGLRTSVGNNPNTDAFGITGSGDPTPTERAGGVAFIELRRTDAEGLQLTQAEEHEAYAIVSKGLTGWKWTSGTRSSVVGIVNPIWVAVNMWLRHLGLDGASSAAQTAVFDVAAAETAAGYCDATVDKVVGSGSTTQFIFRGVVGEQRPFRDWLTEVLANCLGYYTFRNGKLRLGVRTDSVSVESFTGGNMLWRSLRATAFERTATRFTAYFGERRTDSLGQPMTQAENVVAEDEDAALEAGDGVRPVWLEAERSFAGTDNRDQAARLAVTRLRELTGGVTAAERAKARRYQWQTSVLALGAEAGQVDRLTHALVPGGDVEARVESIEFLPDYSVVLTGRSVTDSMYDLTVGSTSADVEPDELPTEETPQLDAAEVENFDAEEDPAGEVDPKTGQTLSAVTLGYDEPIGGSFAGVQIWAQHYDGTDTGTPGSAVGDTFFVTKIPENASPAARRLLFATTNKVLRLGASSYSLIKENAFDWATSPSDYVLLDGKQSAPAEPSNEWCQQLAEGLDLSAEVGAEADLDEARIAFTVDQTPFTLAGDSPPTGAIKDSQIIGTVKLRDLGVERWHFPYRERIYTAQSNGTVVTLEGSSPTEWGVDQWLVETSDGVFTGVNVQFLDEANGVVVNKTVASNTAAALTISGGGAPTGRVRFRFRGAGGELKFFAQHVDMSGNRSQWGAFPECEPFARDGTTDRGQPLVYSPAPSTFHTYFTCGFTGLTSIVDVETAAGLAGVVGVQVKARSEAEAETDADLAKMYSIRGIHTVEIELTYSDDGTTSLQTQTWRMPWKGEGPTHLGALGAWTEVSRHVVDLPGVKVASGRVRLANAWGFGPWATLYAEFVRGGGGAVATGSPAQKQKLVAETTTTGAFAAAINVGWSRVIGPVTGNLTVNLPSPAPEANEEMRLEIIGPASGADGYSLTWGTGMKDGPLVRLVPGMKHVSEWRAESASVMRCVNAVTLPYVA